MLGESNLLIQTVAFDLLAQQVLLPLQAYNGCHHRAFNWANNSSLLWFLFSERLVAFDFLVACDASSIEPYIIRFVPVSAIGDGKSSAGIDSIEISARVDVDGCPIRIRRDRDRSIAREPIKYQIATTALKLHYSIATKVENSELFVYQKSTIYEAFSFIVCFCSMQLSLNQPYKGMSEQRLK